MSKLYLLDSSVIIWHLRNRLEIVQLLTRLVDEAPLAYSPLVLFEVQAGMRDHEDEKTHQFFSSLVEVSLDARTALYAGNLWRSYRGKGITLSAIDTMLAATAIVHDIPFVSLDYRGFPMPELRLVPVPDIG